MPWWYTWHHPRKGGKTVISDEKTRVQITLTKEMCERLDEVCKKVGVTRSGAMGLALNQWLKRVSEDMAIAR